MQTGLINRLAQLALDYSVAMRPGGVVVISGSDTAEPLIYQLFAGTLARAAYGGGNSLGI